MPSDMQISILRELARGQIISVDANGVAWRASGQRVPKRTIGALLSRGSIRQESGRLVLGEQGQRVLKQFQDECDRKAAEEEAYRRKKEAEQVIFDGLVRIAQSRGEKTDNWQRVFYAKSQSEPQVSFTFVCGTPPSPDVIGKDEFKVMIQVDVWGSRKAVYDAFDALRRGLDTYSGELWGYKHVRVSCNDVGNVWHDSRHMSEWTIEASHELLDPLRYGSSEEQLNRTLTDTVHEATREAWLRWVKEHYERWQWYEAVDELRTHVVGNEVGELSEDDIVWISGELGL